MNSKIQNLFKCALLLTVILFMGFNISAQEERINLNKTKDAKSSLDTDEKIERDIDREIRGYANALKIHQIKAVLEFDISKEVERGGDVEDIQGWGSMPRVAQPGKIMHGMGVSENPDIQSSMSIKVEDDEDIDGWGIGASENPDIQGWGKNELEDLDIQGWGTITREDAANIIKADAIEDILNSTRNNVKEFVSEEEIVRQPREAEIKDSKKDRTETKEVKAEDNQMGYAKAKEKAGKKSADRTEEMETFGFTTNKPSKEELTNAARRAREKLDLVTKILYDQAEEMDVAGYVKSDCRDTQCLIKSLKRAISK